MYGADQGEGPAAACEVVLVPAWWDDGHSTSGDGELTDTHVSVSTYLHYVSLSHDQDVFSVYTCMCVREGLVRVTKR